jgi:hypothetical protein
MTTTLLFESAVAILEKFVPSIGFDFSMML